MIVIWYYPCWRCCYYAVSDWGQSTINPTPQLNMPLPPHYFPIKPKNKNRKKSQSNHMHIHKMIWCSSVSDKLTSTQHSIDHAKTQKPTLYLRAKNCQMAPIFCPPLSHPWNFPFPLTPSCGMHARELHCYFQNSDRASLHISNNWYDPH